MEENVNVLHISDIHFGMESTRDITMQAHRKNSLDEMILALSRLEQEDKPDIVVISGDIAWQGKSNAYTLAKQWILQLLSAVNLTPNELVVCAGNHDIERNKTLGINPPRNSAEADSWLSIENLENFTRPFSAFESFCEDLGIPKLSILNQESNLIGQREIEGIKFIVLNSAWFCRGNQDRGKLWIGLPQLELMQATKQILHPDEFDTGIISIGVTHHPKSWLSDEEQHTYDPRPSTYRYLAQRTHLILSGHVHGAIENASREFDRSYLVIGGAAYSGARYRNNFSILKINKQTRVGIQVPYEFDPRNTKWEKKQEKKLFLDSEQGRREEKLTVINESKPNSNIGEIKVEGPIKGLEETRLYQLLIDRENPEEKLSEKVKLIVRHIDPLLARIPENMPEYTLHDATHSIKVINIMGKIIPEETLEKLNSIELTLLIVSGYIHDIGMTCSTEEREKIIESNEFKQLIKADSKYEDYLNYKKTGDHRAATFIEDNIFREYLRKNHVKRSAEYIERLLNGGKFELSIDDISLSKYVIAICNGHGEPVTSLYNTKLWPRDKLIKGHYVNIQYLTIILRLADILDLDPERTPRVLHEFVNPKNNASIQEWRKHRSLIGWDITPNYVVVEAECNFPEVERTLRLFLQWIELERRESIELLKGYTDSISQKYILLLNKPITADRVTSDGSYIYNEVKFELDYQKMINLLMGERLYRNPITALRELLQNAIDAIKARQYLYNSRLENFIPSVSITYRGNKLIIEDNGIGMDDKVFTDYFLQVGKSYYSTGRFKEADLGITSEFGIGVLSVFMIADSMVIESLSELEDRLNPPLPIYYEIPTAHGYCVKRHSNRINVGTSVELLLKENHPFTTQSIKEVVEQIIPHPPFPIEIKTDDGKVIYKKDINRGKLIRFEDDKLNSDFDEQKGQRNAKPTHYLFEIDSNELLKLGIEGQLYIVNSVDYLNFEGRLFGNVSQRNFQIGSPNHSKEDFKITTTNNIQDLFPKWTNVYSNINLVEKGCLTITPDRTDVLLDDKYQQLKQKIEGLIISEIRKHLNLYIDSHSFDEYCSYMDSLIDIGFLGAPIKTRLLSKEAKKLFFDFIYFPIVTFDGRILRKKAKDLKEYRYLGVIDRTWSEEFLPNIAEYASKENLPIIALSKFSKNVHGDDFINQLYGGGLRLFLADITLVSPVSGIEIKVFDKERSQNIIDDYDIVNHITCSLNNAENEMLCVPSNRGQFYHRFNKSHPLIRPLFNNNGYKNEQAKYLFRELCTNFNSIMSTSVNKIDIDIEWLKILHSRRHAEIAKGIFIRDPEVFKEFRRELVSFWGKLVNQDLVDERERMPQVDINDFPWYFNSEMNCLDK